MISSAALARRAPIGLNAVLRSRTPYLLRNAAAANPALFVFASGRFASTDSNVRGGSDSGPPPPGFDVEKAKKPLPQEPASKSEKKDAKTASADSAKSAAAKTGNAKTSAPSVTPAKHDNGKSSAAREHKADTELEEASPEDEKKLTIWEKVKHEAKHYWDGTKLLAYEVRISTRLAAKMAMGYELTRREYRQLKRTVIDLVRLIPFLPFIIVPFGEALLPVVIKVFPGILPSTFEDKKAKDDKTARLRTSRKEVSKFLRSTLRETGLPITKATYQKEQFATFFRKLRMTGESPTAADVIAVCKIFKDDMTLDNLSRPQLVSMCRYLNLSSFGTDMMLRYLIRTRMKQLKDDDKVISFEGVDNLSVSELQTACAGRGIRTHGVSPAKLREDLQEWLDLRLGNKVPSTLLVLSNAYMYGMGQEPTNQIDSLSNVLSSIPDELFHEMELEIHDAEGAATNKQRLEVIKEQEELIEEENEQNEENTTTGLATPRDHDNIDDREERQAKAEASSENPTQVSEAVEAEKEGLSAESATQTPAQKTEGKSTGSGKLEQKKTEKDGSKNEEDTKA
ncbi:uncharacterized protein MKZ38_001784 [Zalerion maritima]|uniref:Letm1 RBD domain-containing protein n=1 Tax=Zalerion maritima TaxID=339359 RepID=A0AAD5RXG6_9PEZI|nr:uncharacterized protein MKZ38_001784 [Zalerion maritima]